MSDAHRDEVAKIITDEGLRYFNWYEQREPAAEEVGIVPRDGGWLVYITNERAGWKEYDPIVHADEDEALDDFLDRLRDLNFLIQRQAERRHRG
jgi:hypothetical protein